RPAAGKGRGGHGPCHLLPAQGPARFFLRHLPQRFRQAHSVAGTAVSRRSEGSQRDRRSVAGLSRLDHASDDHAAPPLRLLLADADAGAGDRLGRQRGADRLSLQERRGWRDRGAGIEARSLIRNVAILLIAGTIGASAQQKPVVDTVKIDTAIAAACPTAPADWKARFDQDETMKACSLHENSPPKAVAETIATREKARIEYPADGKILGDLACREEPAPSGYGLRFTDYPARQVNGGNCYACHQL